jgi:Na+-driven multidrug efflux pump
MSGKNELGSARKIAVMAVLVSTQLIQMMPLGSGVAASIVIGKEISGGNGKEIWIAASYPLVLPDALPLII